MTKNDEVYKCNVCGNVVEVVAEGAGELTCCGEAMELLEEKSSDEGQEKHVPVIEKVGDSVIVKVGSVPHPMEGKHFISMIEVVADGKTHRRFLSPGDKPEARFDVKSEGIKAREYCTIHGLWKSK